MFLINNIVKETSIGNCGSKSIILESKSIVVKEQRVNGNLQLLNNYIWLNYTLMDLETNYQAIIPSKQINIQTRLLYCHKVVQQSCREKHIQNLSHKMNPWFITGFVDGEGSFWVNISRENTFKIGWRVKLYFQIALHKRDKVLLEQINNFFVVGKIYKNNNNEAAIYYTVTSVRDLTVIRKHFEKYTLNTKKRYDFELWIKILDIIKKKEHLSMEGFEKIVAIRASINRGLSDKLKAVFPHIVPVQKPDENNIDIFDPYWLAGFVSAEGCFYVNIKASSNSRLGFKVQLMFRLAQHARDENLMRSLIKYFDCGNIYKNIEVFEYRVTKFTDIEYKIIPFFQKYPILGVKSKDFTDFYKVFQLMNNGAHLTKEGLCQIRRLKAGMNTGRKFN